MADGINAKTKKRMSIIMAVLTLFGFGALIFRLFSIQIVDGE